MLAVYIIAAVLAVYVGAIVYGLALLFRAIFLTKREPGEHAARRIDPTGHLAQASHRRGG